MRNLSIIILLLFLSSAVYSQNTFVDSLYNIVEAQSGKEKLETFRLIIARSARKDLNLINRLELEAKAQQHHHYISIAYVFKSLYYNEVNSDSAFYYINLSIEEAKLSDHPTLYEENKTLLVGYYIQKGKNELVLHYIKEILDDNKYDKNNNTASMLFYYMGTAYLKVNRYKESIEAYQAAIRTHTDMPPPLVLIRNFGGLANAASMNSNDDLALTTCDSMKYVVDNRAKDFGYTEDIINQMRLAYEFQYVLAYDKKEDMVNVRLHLDKIKAILILETSDFDKYNYYLTEANYYYKMGDFDKAESFINKCCLFNPVTAHVLDFSLTNLLKTKILAAKNDYAEAYKLLDETYALRDFTIVRGLSAQMDELQTIYKVDKMKLEIEAQKSKLQFTKLVALLSIIAILLLIGIICIIRRSSIVQREKNKKLYSQYEKIDSYIIQIKELNLLTKNERDEQPQEDANPILNLADRIDLYMEETEAFKNSELSRDDLALELGTNRQYLTEAIRANTDKTFSEYLTNWRLEYTRHKLSTDQSISIADIWVEAGFASRSTFNRLFKQHYGMSPNEFRSIIYEVIEF